MQVWKGTPPASCDVCKNPINNVFIDGKLNIVGGPWAFFCEDCHADYGVGIGEGKGQKYQKQNGEYVKIAG